MNDLNELQKTIGYVFHDVTLLQQAISHSSYANEHRPQHCRDNERLEFLGDAVLELSVSEFLFENYPEMAEGDMTKLRASLVCEPTLALCARAISLPPYLLLGRGEEHTGGRERNSIVSDALEALIGAIYLDGSFEEAKRFVRQFVLNDIEHKQLFFDSKTILQEIVQRDFRNSEISYRLAGEEGPDHAKRYLVELMIGDEVFGTGRGSTKKGAEQEAAYQAILRLRAAEK